MNVWSYLLAIYKSLTIQVVYFCNEQLTVCPAILDRFHQCSQYHKYFYKVEYGELWITAIKLADKVSDVASLYSKYLPLNNAECSKAVKWQFPAEWLLS